MRHLHLSGICTPDCPACATGESVGRTEVSDSPKLYYWSQWGMAEGRTGERWHTLYVREDDYIKLLALVCKCKDSEAGECPVHQ